MPLPQKLTPEQVVEMRKHYFYDLWTYKELELSYHVSKNTVVAAVQGQRGYAKIKDEISDEHKESREPYREVWASDKSQRRKQDRQNLKWMGKLNNIREENQNNVAPRRKW